MKRYKVNLEVTGYIEFEETTEQASLFDEQKDEKISEAQYWYLANSTNLPEDVINALSTKLAHELIGKMKQKEREKIQQEAQPKIDKIIANIDKPFEVSYDLKEKLSKVAKKMCKEPFCGKQSIAKGLCRIHYNKQYNERKDKHAI